LARSCGDKVLEAFSLRGAQRPFLFWFSAKPWVKKGWFIMDGTPIAGWFIMGNPTKMDDLGENHHLYYGKSPCFIGKSTN
jgi:hypothetical protein